MKLTNKESQDINHVSQISNKFASIISVEGDMNKLKINNEDPV